MKKKRKENIKKKGKEIRGSKKQCRGGNFKPNAPS
jgi:hypothetical protein